MDLRAPPRPGREASRGNGAQPRFLNRELSWLDFNERVLAMAEDETQPLLERAKFHAIFSHNLDDFFQIRVAGLKEQVKARLGTTSVDGMAPADQLDAIRARVGELTARQARSFADDLAPALRESGVCIVDWQ